MRTFLILIAAVQLGAALHPSTYRPLHVAAVVLSLAVLGLVSWLDRRHANRCEYCARDGRCSICK